MARLRTTKVIGIKELSQKFQAMAKEMGGAAQSEITFAGALEIEEAVQQKIVERDLIETGNLLDSVRAFKVNQYTSGLLVDAVYAAVHEYGLFNQIITERQRRFFWAQFSGTGDEMWKALALSTTYTIPPRPYVRPGVTAGKPAARKAMAAKTLELLQKYGK